MGLLDPDCTSILVRLPARLTCEPSFRSSVVLAVADLAPDVRLAFRDDATLWLQVRFDELGWRPVCRLRCSELVVL